MMITNLFPKKPLDHRTAQWMRLGLRLLGLLAWLLLALLGLTATGCRATTASPPTATVVPFPTFTATPVAQPTMPPATTVQATPAAPQSASLPAALYLLTSDGQVARLDADGSTITLLTTEPEPIVAFDVAQTDGRLIYIADNQLIEFDPDTEKRTVKLTSLPAAELWENVNGSSSCAKCDTDQLLAPRYSPDGSQIAYAQNGINMIASGADATASPRKLQANVRFQFDTQDVNATRFYDDSAWSPDGTRLVFHAIAWEWAGYEIYDFAQDSLIIVRSPTVPGVHLCCHWQWGMDSQTGYVTALLSHGPIEDTGLYRVDAATATVTQLSTGTSSQYPRLQRAAHTAYQTPFGEVYLFIQVNDEQWPYQPALYMMHRIDPNDGAPTPLNPFQIPIEGETLWAPDGSGAVVMTASFALPDRPTVGKFVWLPTQSESGNQQSLHFLGSHLRWRPTRLTPFSKGN